MGTILPRLHEAKAASDVHRILHEEFAHWFGGATAGPETAYAELADGIWAAWLAHQRRD